MPESGRRCVVEGLGGSPAITEGPFSSSSSGKGLGVFLALDRFLMKQASTMMKAMRATPPTTPPAMAPTGVAEPEDAEEGEEDDVAPAPEELLAPSVAAEAEDSGSDDDVGRPVM